LLSNSIKYIIALDQEVGGGCDTMSKKFKGKRCVYCVERDAVTGDHIFAREFFLPASRSNLPQVPACLECNNKKSKLEHYLTTVIPFGGRHSASVEILSSMVPKRLARNARLHRELAAGKQREATTVPQGAVVRTMTVPIDGDQLEQLFAMIARGLIWYHWKVCLQGDHSVQVHTVTQFGEQVFDGLLFKLSARQRVRADLGDGTFVYEGVQAKDDAELTAWRFSVYGGLAACDDVSVPASFGSQIIVVSGSAAVHAMISQATNG
jgi:hypothetical protein